MEQLSQILSKSLLIFFMLIILTRAIGRKLLSQMSYFDFVIGITIGTIAGSFVAQRIEGMWVLISPVFLTIMTILFGYISMKSIHMRKIMAVRGLKKKEYKKIVRCDLCIPKY